MKVLKSIKTIVLLLTIVSIISCSNDDSDIVNKDELVGVWLRSDYSDTFEYKLYFSADNTGYFIESSGNLLDEFVDDTPALGHSSYAAMYTWSAKNNILTLDYGSDELETETTSYYFNSNNQLILKELNDFPFDKFE